LSIICGAVCWLFDHEKRELNQLKKTLELFTKNIEGFDDDDDDDWIVGQSKLVEQQRKVYEINALLKSLEEFNNNIEQIKKVLNILKIILYSILFKKIIFFIYIYIKMIHL
jgi:hypothetical protein